MRAKGWLACLLAAALLLTMTGGWTALAAESTAGTTVTEAPEENRLAGRIPTKGLTDTVWSACSGQVSQLTDGALVLESAHNDTRRVNFYHGTQGGYDRFTFDMGAFYALDRFLLGSEYAAGQRVRMVDVYVSDSRETLYDEGSRVVNGMDVTGINTLFTLPEAVEGRYVGFSIYIPRLTNGSASTDPDHSFYTSPNGWYGMLRLGELGAYGTPVERPVMTAIAAGASYDIAATLGANRMSAVTDVYWYGQQPAGGELSYLDAAGAETAEKPTALSAMRAFPIEDYLYMTDSRVPSVQSAPADKAYFETKEPLANGSFSGAAAVEALTQGQYTTYYYVFALDQLYEYSSVLVGQPEEDAFNMLWFGQVYASETLETLFDADSLRGEWNPQRIYDGATTETRAYLFTAATVRSARYVGLVAPQQQGTMLRLGELGLYGGGTQATVTRLERNRSRLTDSSERYAAWTADVNRLAGRSAYTYNTDAAALGSPAAARAGTGYDGSVITDKEIWYLSRIPAAAEIWSTANPTGWDGNSLFAGLPAAAYTGALPGSSQAHRVQARLVYDLGRAYELTRFVVGQGMDSAFQYKLWYAEVYVSSDPATLYAAENRVAAYSYVNEDGSYGRKNGGITDAALVLEPDRPVTGRYVGFAFPMNNSASGSSGELRVTELGAYGQVSGVVGDPLYLTGTEQADAVTYAGENLVAGMVERLLADSAYAGIATYKNGALTRVQYQAPQRMVDGLVAGVNAADGDGAQGLFISETAYREFTDPGTAAMVHLVFDLEEITGVSRVLIGYANDPQTQYRSWAGQVYVSETLEELYDDSSLLGSWSYVENGALPGTIADKGVLFETEQPRWGRYVSLVVPVNFRTPANAVRFQEIGIYATPIEEVGSQIRTGAADLVSGADTAAARADMRFATAVRVPGVAVDAETDALELSAAYLTVGGVRYPVSGMGTLVARSLQLSRQDLPDAALTHETVAAYGGADVPAQVVYDTSAYDAAAGTGTLVYTAVVRDIPCTQYTEPLVARGYIRYDKGNGESGYLYGGVMRRSVYDVWRDTVNEAQQAGDTTLQVRARADYLPKGSGRFRKGSRVVFLGDSITYDARFAQEIAQYYAAHYPEDRVEFYMDGIRGGNVGGALTYLEDDTLAYRPDYVVAMFGMNDIGRGGYNQGSYEAVAETQYKYIEAFEANMRQLVERLQAAGVTVLLCTPSAYDDTCTKAEATAYVGCNRALQKCAERVRAIAADTGCAVADFNAPMVEALAYVQSVNSEYSIINNTDRVHPGTIGHDLMARVFLHTLVDETVAVPTNEQLLSYVQGSAQPDTELGVPLELRVKAQKALTGAVPLAVRSYWEAEFHCVGTNNYGRSPEERQALVDRYECGDFRGTVLKPRYAANAAALGANMAATRQAARALYE